MDANFRYNFEMLLLRISLFSLLLLFFAFGALQAQYYEPEPLKTITLHNVGSPDPIRVYKENGIEYLSATDLFRALQAHVSWSSKENKLDVTLYRRKLVFQMSNRFCSVDGYPYNLVYQPLYHVDDLYIPVRPTVYLLSDVLERTLVYAENRHAIIAVGKEENVVGIQISEKLNGDLLEILLSRRLDYDVFVSEGNWINVTIAGGEVDTNTFGLADSSDKILDVRAFQFDNSAQISVQMRQPITRYQASYAPNPHRIQIALERSGFTKDQKDTQPLVKTGKYDSLDVIVIDPGHGGEHDGAIGKNGLKEKDVTLDIALRLEKIMLKEGRFIPILTRRTDKTVGLNERAMIANQAKGDLFISIHCNSSENRSAVGSETYFLAAAKSDDARITALLENSDFQLDVPEGTYNNREKDDLDFIVMDVLQTEYLSQSQQLAEFIQESLKKRLNVPSRGVNQAGFAVLNRVEMPSVLVETAFISNKVEERLLDQENFRQAAAESIYQGIVRFANLYEREVRANAQSE